MSMFDKHELSLPCSHCGRKTKKSIGWIKRHQQFTCVCGVTTFKANELIRGIREADRTIDKFKRNLRCKFR